MNLKMVLCFSNAFNYDRSTTYDILALQKKATGLRGQLHPVMGGSMVSASIRIGGRTVLAEGIVICPEAEPLALKLGRKTFEISFLNRPGDPPSFNNVERGNVLKVQVINADVPTSTGIMPVGKVDEKDLYLSIFVQRYGQQTPVRLIAYNFSA
jgi:hypothetical protein